MKLNRLIKGLIGIIIFLVTIMMFTQISNATTIIGRR